MLVKNYSDAVMGPKRRYSPSAYTGAIKKKITGNPDMSKVSTSYVERQNLTMRMGMAGSLAYEWV